MDLLNARGRLCLVHDYAGYLADPAPEAAQRPGASLSGSRYLARSTNRLEITAQRPGASLSGSRRHVEGDDPTSASAQRPGASLSGSHRIGTIEQLVLTAAQRPGASLSGSPLARGRWCGLIKLLNARGRLCLVHRFARSVLRSRMPLLNARGRLCLVHTAVPGGVTEQCACSTPGGVFVWFTVGISRSLVAPTGCSTPGGVFVWFTTSPLVATSPQRRLLNARGRLCLVHKRIEATFAADEFTAQRPGASLSGSHLFDGEVMESLRTAQRPGASLSGSLGAGRTRIRAGSICSTPGGVFVWFTERAARSHLSGTRLLNARGRLCLVHFFRGLGVGMVGSCSTPGGVFVWFTRPASRGLDRSEHCSTPGGVFVWFTWIPIRWNRLRNDSAQRPGASLSGSREPSHRVARAIGSCSTPGGVFVWFTCSRVTSFPLFQSCSTPGGVFVWFTAFA